MFLPKVCQAQRANAGRLISEIRSSGYVAPGPVNPATFVEEGPVNYMNSEATQYVAPAEAPAY